MVGFSSIFYGAPDLIAGLALVAVGGIAEGFTGWVGLFAIARGIMTIGGGGMSDPSDINYKLFYGGGDFLIGAAMLPSEFAYFFFVRGVASAVGLAL
jgi:hypothetical protein